MYRIYVYMCSLPKMVPRHRRFFRPNQPFPMFYGVLHGDSDVLMF